MTCDIFTGILRPYVLHRFRQMIFVSLLSISHPGICATRLVTSRYVWPFINMDVRKWACLCQRAMVHCHVATPLGTFATPDTPCDHMHIDVVGPMPPSNGSFYLLICVGSIYSMA